MLSGFSDPVSPSTGVITKWHVRVGTYFPLSRVVFIFLEANFNLRYVKVEDSPNLTTSNNKNKNIYTSEIFQCTFKHHSYIK